MNKVLFVPIDLNENAIKHSQDLLLTAAEIAQAMKWKVCIFHAFTVPLAPPDKDDGGYTSHATESKRRQEQIKKLLNDTPGIHSVLDEVMIEQGGAEGLICEVAKKHKVDMILMGAKDKHDLQSKILGSTSEYVIRHAHCNVLILPEQAQSGAPLKINLLIDENRIEDASQLDLLTKLAGALTTKLMITYVGEQKETGAETKDVFQYILDQLPEGVETSARSLINGDSANAEERVHRWGHENRVLLAIPFHQEGIVEKLFAPSLMTKLVKHSPSPILILR